MLERADRLPWPDGIAIPVVHLEDLIGLKVQALVNDPLCRDRDWADIFQMIRHARDHSLAVDWELLGDYFSLFNLNHKLAELTTTYGQTL